MQYGYIYCEVAPTAEGADLTFFSPSRQGSSRFSINAGSGLVGLSLVLDLQELKVLKCNQEEQPIELEPRKGRASNRRAQSR